MAAWSDTVIALGSDRDEVTVLQRAVDRAVAIGVGELAGAQPDWLHHLIGPRPTDPIGATSWDAIVGDVVAWRQRHPATAGGDGLGPTPDDTIDAREWQDLTARCASARTWLTTAARHEPSWPVVRSHRELSRRHQELDAILDTAPDDTRHVINAARSGQLALTDLDEIVRNANDTRTARKHWILEHWPHVVEYAEITNTLRNQTWGPDPDAAFAGIDHRAIGDDLATALTTEQPWLRTALVALDPDDHTPLTDDQLNWLNNVAAYRTAHNVTGRDPLGSAPIDTVAHDEYLALLDDLDHARVRPEPREHDLDLDVGIEL